MGTWPHATGPERVLRGLPADPPAPRSDVLLGDTPAAGGDPAGDARALRLRPHGRRDRRRPAPRPPPQARRAALDAWEAELEAGLAGGSSDQPVVARWSTPAAATACRSASCAPTCARCASTARRCGSRPGTSCPTWTARPARWAASWPPLLGVPERHHARLRPARARVPARELHPRRARGPAAGPHLPAGRGPRALRGGRERLRPAERRRPSCARWSPHEVRRARGAVRERRGAAVDAAPASVRPGIRLACAIYVGVLDRVEAIGFDVLGRRTRHARLAAPAASRCGRCGVTRRATLRGARATPLGRASAPTC